MSHFNLYFLMTFEFEPVLYVFVNHFVFLFLLTGFSQPIVLCCLFLLSDKSTYIF